jgi:hypothetical protein
MADACRYAYMRAFLMIDMAIDHRDSEQPGECEKAHHQHGPPPAQAPESTAHVPSRFIWA